MASAEGTRGRSRLSRIVRQEAPVETPQPDETTVTSSSRSSTREAELREDAIYAHSRFLRAEAWLEAHDEAHPRWDDAMSRCAASIIAMASIEEQARELGIENIFGNLSENH